ncbi:MAG: glycoside hydrolase family 5 protein [Ruminococcaceae bacterium]|nr:glycoside hydrolase family 5 protein [Oscillospiraceae bacterium]
MERIIVDEKRFVDEYGRHRIFNGVNFDDKCGDRWSCLYNEDLMEITVRKMSRNGWNVIRLGIPWAAIEPKPCEYNDKYIDKVIAFLDLCEKYGIHVFLDMHQDLFGGSVDQFGDGAPEWACLRGTKKQRKSKLVWATGYFWDKGVHNCFDNFWADTKVNGVGLQTYFINMWCHLAERVKEHPALLGFDLFNEPYPGSDGGKMFRKLIFNLAKTVITDRRCKKMWLVKQLLTGNSHRVLEPFEDPDLFRKVTKAGDKLQRKFDEGVYSSFINRLSKAIRDVTEKGIIIVESCYYTNLGIPFFMSPVSYDGKREEQLCYSPHGYDLTVDTPTYDYASNSRVWSIFEEKKRTQEKWNKPILVGEWGGFWSGDRWLEHLKFLLDKFDENQWSQAYYTYTLNFIIFESYEKVERILKRPVPRAVCGKIDGYRHDREENAFYLEFTQEREYDVPTVTYVHKDIEEIETDGEYKIIPLGENGESLIEINTPPGNHKVTVKFK